MCGFSLLASIAAIYYFSKLIIEVRFSEKAIQEKKESERQKREQEAKNEANGKVVGG